MEDIGIKKNDFSQNNKFKDQTQEFVHEIIQLNEPFSGY